MDYAVLMELVCRLGTRLAKTGAETYRVEESINRILAAYGLDSKVYSVPGSLIISVVTPDGYPITQLCRMEHIGSDLDAVELYSNLSRRICAEKPDPAMALQWLQVTEHQRKRYAFPVRLLGYILVAWGFCVFFGGTLADSIAAALCGLLLGFVDRFLDRIQVNTFFQKIAASFLMALAAYAMAATGLLANVDTVVIGTLMLLVPGLLFTNALRDIIFGDTNSGTNRIVQVLLIAAAIALGTAAAWNFSTFLWTMPAAAPSQTYGPLVTCAVSFIACGGFVLVFNIHGRGAWLCALGGVVTWGVYCIFSRLGSGELLSCFAATVAAAIFSEVMARVRKYPAISYLVISLLPLIPGAGVYYTAQQVVQGNMAGSLAYGSSTLATAGVMAVGILVVSTAMRVWHQWEARK